MPTSQYAQEFEAAKEAIESWEESHKDAMACLNLEKAINELLPILEQIWELEDRTRIRICNEPKANLSFLLDSAHQVLSTAYWLVARLYGSACLFDKQGFTIKNFDILQEKFADLHFALMSNADFFARFDCSDLANAALKDSQQGNTETMESLWE
jgi:hypothetical protein